MGDRIIQKAARTRQKGRNTVAPDSPALTPEDLRQARQAAEQFLQAVQRGDEAAARGLLILGEGGKLDFKSMNESIASFALGEAQSEGEQVVVVATAAGKPDQPQMPPLPMVLKCIEGAWKIDMPASINRMLGVDLEKTMATLVQGLGDAMAKGMQAMGEGLSAGLSVLSPGASPPQGEGPHKEAPGPGSRIDH
jgi:hypothetical protein